MSSPKRMPKTYHNGPPVLDVDVPILDLEADFNRYSRAIFQGRTTSWALDVKMPPSYESTIQEDHPASKPEPPFHVFTKRQTWGVVLMIGFAGMFSGLSSNIYFPSLDAISKDLNVSLEEVNLTITSYLILQGLSPLLWGPLSDSVGRRPIYIASFTLYIIANIILSISPNFPVLLIFRGLQSAGSASTVSIGNGVIQDIATPADRGAYIAFYQAIRNFSIAVGPVLGGVLAQFFGFRSVFVFLTLSSSLMLVIFLVFLPETLRSIAGNGAIRLKGIYQPFIRTITKEPEYIRDADEDEDEAQAPKKRKVTMMTFVEPLKLLTQKDMIVTLGFGGLVYSVWSMLVSSTTELFKHRFGLSELTLGLVFLPNGLGTIAGSSVAGALLTRDFQHYESIFLAANPGAPAPSTSKKSLPAGFAVEHARLRQMPWIVALFALATGAYGFTVLSPPELQPFLGAAAASPAWIAVPLALQFLVAATSNAVFAINTTLVADLYPGQGASATAVNNLVRCSMAAGGVALMDVLLEKVGPGVVFLFLALLVLGSSALVAVEWRFGMGWRAKRESKRRQAEWDAMAKMDVEKR